MRFGQNRDPVRDRLTRPASPLLGRPEPDEVLLDEEPTPQPERHEPRVAEPGLRDLTLADWKAILVRAVKGFMNDNAMLLASALAYSSFFAIPAVLLVAIGVFTLVVGPDTITTLLNHFNNVMPTQATSLLKGSLQNLNAH